MDINELEARITSLQHRIDTDAEYTRPEHRIAGEQTLALLQIALVLSRFWELEPQHRDIRGDIRGSGLPQ